jgi:hypothetical protein
VLRQEPYSSKLRNECESLDSVSLSTRSSLISAACLAFSDRRDSISKHTYVLGLQIILRHIKIFGKLQAKIVRDWHQAVERLSASAEAVPFRVRATSVICCASFVL